MYTTVILRLKGTVKTILKANISIYENDSVTVSDTGYLFWVLDYFKVEMRRTFPQS